MQGVLLVHFVLCVLVMQKWLDMTFSALSQINCLY